LVETYTYDALGETLTKTDRNGTVHNYVYDVLGRVISDWVDVASGVDDHVLRIDTSYNTQGLVDKITSFSDTNGTSAVNQVQNTYNGFGQLTKQAQEHSGTVTSSSLAVQYTYSDAASGSRLTSMVYPNGTTLAYNYGTANGLNDVISRLDAMKQGTLTVESYKYLGLSTVVERYHQQGSLTLTYIGTPDSTGDKYAGLDRFGRVIDQKWTTTSGGTVDE
jgi:YD repeat-containing protein